MRRLSLSPPMKNAGRPEANVLSRLRPGMPAVGGRRRAEVRRQHLDAVVEPAEPEVGEERRRERPVDAIGQALVAGIGDAAEADELVAAALLPKTCGPSRRKSPEAVAAEGVDAVAQPSVDADVERSCRRRSPSPTPRSC